MELSPEENAFVDRMGLVMERFGGARTMGRIYGALLICDPPSPSLTELASALQVSKASISTVTRQMVEAGLIERVPAANRQHRYRVMPGGWSQVLRIQFSGLRMVLDTLDQGLAMRASADRDQRQRLEETRDFFAFVDADASHMLRRYAEYKKTK
ncbi:GbsR/MarR family transcriptional regulator [Tenggerimyces flavus]|uniref:GbsR/MarR family transcriptional regulator n=1 Tax=Tenggerimyces flavus TaxID=1708749 RepID=A0ABV7YDD6_9ACTN|nr:MarR family transcriptional regulator [Tenggerimyces flavus]MBM7788044.1 DNA-binding transcriptional regulator GbsR (MarR family) [Tenggerimyces flavus]